MGTCKAAIAAFMIAGLCLVASATAATPKHGDYVDRSGKGTNAVIDLNVLTSLTEMQPNFFNKCSKVPVGYLVKIKPSGKFSFQGTKPDINGKKVKISISGKFESSTRATGTVDYDSSGCKGKPVDFVAKFEGVIS